MALKLPKVDLLHLIPQLAEHMVWVHRRAAHRAWRLNCGLPQWCQELARSHMPQGQLDPSCAASSFPLLLIHMKCSPFRAGEKVSERHTRQII